MKKEINFLGKRVRRVFMILSLLFVIIGMYFFFTKGLNYSIDFQSGSVIYYKLSSPLNSNQIANLRDIARSFYSKSTIQTGSNGKEVWIRTKFLEENELKRLTSEVEKVIVKYEGREITTIEPTISRELREKAILAAVLAIIVMLVYITVRFRFDFAISAIINEAFVLLATISIFAISQWEVSPSFIAAILTLLGYAINDNIIVFDRIRENSKKYPKEDFTIIANRSINQTLARTLYTVITTLLAITPLLIWGGVVLRPFILAIYLGIIIGTYSTIYIASAILCEWRELQK
ncbi:MULTISPECIES: protein translocase subunit SecF [Dictyoglomus]|uniref:Protein translocase subunit SecF n=1 Tax=Dictyoglomus turgidum (strain DSM 6724 / Z-1310) TaxID=515635 RepID=SECF_DICTD|nr:MULTISPECIES: protein translocase subunit SecF [Dictyoglomus]B8E2N2.1 RecName: Full=Protein translocase subunit SecF [Dictyoglomus turgidum DSM 6724]ACK42876.1 protein-export membrane protein SecF [Dictyoglomus turgidum DSM 6724]HBU30938.1 protein translocase subunit SecF [Dictyoglomus sp.]